MDIHGYSWMFMDIYGYPGIFVDIRGYPRIFKDIHATDIHGYPRIFVDIHGFFTTGATFFTTGPTSCECRACETPKFSQPTRFLKSLPTI